MQLYSKIFVGLLAGTAVGVLAKWLDHPWLRDGLVYLEPLGNLFIRLITMVVVPLVASSLFVATASLGDVRRLAGIGGRTLGYFLSTTLIAATIGLGLGLLIRPGAGIDAATRDALAAQFEQEVVGPTSVQPPSTNLLDTVLNMVPRNPVASAAQMDLLPLIVAVVIFGAAVTVIRRDRRRVVISFSQAINDMSMVVIQWVMALAPAAVFFLIGATVAKFGVSLLQRLFVYSLVVVGGLTLHALVTFTLALRGLARTKLTPFYKAVAAAPLLAFSTASSNATLPVSMEVVETRLGISKRVASFVLPLGATLNMNGSALYKAVTAVFVLQVYGLPIGGQQIAAVLVTATLAAVAGVGIPGSSLVTTLIVLNAVGLGPQAAAGIAMVAGVDRILDMFRTAVNVTGDLTCAAYIARGEGETFGLAGEGGERSPPIQEMPEE